MTRGGHNKKRITTMQKIAFIGLGKMGKGMASNLQKKGFQLTVFDINPEPIAALVALGAKAAKSIEDASKGADVVITMLPASSHVESVILGENGVLAHLKKGAMIIDMSTISPETTDKLHEAANKKHIEMVDAPVGRLAAHADRGESLFMVGATNEGFARAKPLLEGMGTTIHHCGAGGSGTRMKLVNNYLAIILCQLNAECLSLSQRFDLDLAKTLEVLNGTTATNGQLKVNWVNKVLIGDVEPGFSIDLAHKDLSLILESANSAKVPMPVAAAAREAFSNARAKGYGNQDFSAMVDVACDAMQVKRARL
jgi:4-hydroxybutyrate dehydrogenase / sulfolactaldehyde 3-reductase